jgi:hypothetical protein
VRVEGIRVPAPRFEQNQSREGKVNKHVRDQHEDTMVEIPFNTPLGNFILYSVCTRGCTNCN